MITKAVSCLDIEFGLHCCKSGTLVLPYKFVRQMRIIDLMMDDLSSNTAQASLLPPRHNQFQYVALKPLLAV